MGGNSKVCEAKHRTAAAAAAPTPAELRTDMVTTPDFTALQQQFRQDMTDVIQQLRVEVNETVSGRKDMLNSTNTALQKTSAKPTASKLYRICDLFPRNFEGSHDRG